ncbi:MAG: alanine--tRNA ligase, partial [Bdellovibrionales bacterium]|nr:alanine--tRNA ligase [Bdellovibrionales bacterium]
PKPSVDTGMGLERISSILQDVPTNYDIDLFREIFSGIEKLSGRRYGGGSPDDVVAMRVVADHLRAVSFLVADGVMPSNEGRGYVLRRILRRAVRYGKKLGFEGAFLEKLVPCLVKAMGDAYPDLREKENFVRAAIRAEEEKFFETLGRGLEILVGETAKLKKGGKIPGDVVFLLYDSFGFPVDLTRVIAAEQGLGVDEAGFEKLMEKQRAQSRGTKGETAAKGNETYAALAGRLKPTEFTGYTDCEGEGTITAILVNGQEVREAQAGVRADLVFDRSPFYGESGGQVGDTGEIFDGERVVAKVLDVKKPLPELTVVKAEATGLLKVGARYFQKIPEEQRRRTAANHSGTHLLHWALRQVLGAHVKQAGSLVGPDLLRFDFTHFQAMKPEELEKVERIVNERIASAAEVGTRLMKKDDAIRAGAMALFGEKYDSDVRVVSMAESAELCGGVHVGNTAEIRLLLITGETGVAAGVRRITALTGQTAVDHMRSRMSVLSTVQERLKAVSPEDTVAKVERLQARERELEKKLQAVQEESAGSIARHLVAGAKDKNGVKILAASLSDGSAEFLRAVCERSRNLLPSGLIALAIHDQSQGKVTLMVSVSPDLTKTYNAGKLIQAAAPLIGGKGGGKPELAQAGGSNAAGISAALDQIAGSV